MLQFLLVLDASWVSGCEDPGGKADMHTRKEQQELVRIEAGDLEQARVLALAEVNRFWESLPKRYDGSLFWQKDDPVLRVEFSQVLPLQWEDQLRTAAVAD